MPNDDDDPWRQPPPLPSQPPASRSRGLGCFLKGCLTTVTVLMLLGVGVGVFGWFFLKGGQSYLGDHPAPVQIAAATDAQYADLLERLRPLREAMDEGRAATVEISADDLNTLVARAPQLAPLRGRVFVNIVHDQLVADLSWPIDDAPPGQHFINAHAAFDASYAGGKFTFALRRAFPFRGEAEDEGLLPWMLRRPEVLQGYSQWINRELNGFVHDQSSQDPATGDILAKLHTAIIQDNHIVLTTVARPDPTSTSAPSPTVSETSD